MEPDLSVRKSLNSLCDPFLDTINYDDYDTFCKRLEEVAQQKIHTLVKERQKTIKSLLKNRIPFNRLSESFVERIFLEAFLENETPRACNILENLIEKEYKEGKILINNSDWQLMMGHMSVKSISRALQHFYIDYEFSPNPIFKDCFLSLIYLFFNIKNQALAAKNKSDDIKIRQAVKRTLGSINWKTNSKNTRFIELSILRFNSETKPNL